MEWYFVYNAIACYESVKKKQLLDPTRTSWHFVYCCHGYKVVIFYLFKPVHFDRHYFLNFCDNTKLLKKIFVHHIFFVNIYFAEEYTFHWPQ